MADTTTPVVLSAEVVAISEMKDAEIAAAAVRLHEQAVASADGAVQAATRAGELLAEAQRRCKRDGRSFSDWLLRHWTKSDKIAYRYIALAQAARTEVQQNSLPRAGEGIEGLARLPLNHPSARAALEAIGYDAGGVRRSALPEDPDEREAAEERRMEQLAEEAAQPPAARGPAHHVGVPDAARRAVEAAADQRRREERRKAEHEAAERARREKVEAEFRRSREAFEEPETIHGCGQQLAEFVKALSAARTAWDALVPHPLPKQRLKNGETLPAARDISLGELAAFVETIQPAITIAQEAARQDAEGVGELRAKRDRERAKKAGA